MNQRWAVIGTGSISAVVVSDLQSCDGVDVVLVHSRTEFNAARFAGEHNIPAWTSDYQAVLDDAAIDAVYIATPIGTHFDLTRAALQAGKHVLVEKPMATSAADATELFATAHAHRRFLMEGMWMKFNPAFLRLREEIANGLIGTTSNVRAGFSVPFPQDGARRWDPTQGGGALLDQGIYPITLAHTILGAPTSVHAHGVTRADGLDLETHITLEFGGMNFAQLTTSMVQFSDCSAAVAGDKGWITLPAPFWATTDLEIHAGGAQHFYGNGNRIHLTQEGNGYVPMLRAVIAAIRDGLIEHPTHPAVDTIAVSATIDAVFAQIKPTHP